VIKLGFRHPRKKEDKNNLETDKQHKQHYRATGCFVSNLANAYFWVNKTNQHTSSTVYAKVGKKRRKSCKRNYYIISAGVKSKAIIIIS